MKRYFLLIVLCVFSLNSLWPEEFCAGASCMPAKILDDCTVMENNGCIDWANGVVYATGMGVPNPKFPTQAQRKYSAYAAAKIVAMRNLLQMIEGINISSSRTVKAGMLESDVIHTQISGKLRHVQEAGKPRFMDDGSIWVTMKMYLRDIMSILVNNREVNLQESASSAGNSTSRQTGPPLPAKGPHTTANSGSSDVVYSGLVIDARGTGITPALSPKIYDANGREVYGSAAVSRDFALKHGIAGYVKDINSAKSNNRVEGEPLIIKADLVSGKSSDLSISDKNAKLLRKLEDSQTFLQEGRVIIIR